MKLTMSELDGPLGPMFLAVSDAGLCALGFASQKPELLHWLRSRYPGAEEQWAEDAGGLVTRIRAYLDGDLDALDGVEVDADGTPFQRSVWKALREIPAGHTISYGELAKRLDRPGAARAVGLANGKNPVSIVIPCHRVIASDGSPCGYGGGVDRKRWLLEHERRHARR